jgi:hypothetical protein
MSQSRKQKVLEQVQKQRRQRNIASIVIAIVIIAIIVTAVIFYPRPPPNPVSLPGYLSHCVTSSTYVYHSHPNLTIFISGTPQPIPANTASSSCLQPIHTHDSSGILHVETDENRDYTLGDWFLLWGNSASNANLAIFNSTQIFNNKVGNGHTLVMTVNGQTSFAFQTLALPRNAATGSATCTPTPCRPYSIVITYS